MSRSKVKVTRPTDAHKSCTLSSEWQGLQTSNLVYGWRTTTRISHRRCDLQCQRSRSQAHVISLSRLGQMLSLSLQAVGIPRQPNPAAIATLLVCCLLFPPRWRLCGEVSLSVNLSVCLQPHAETCMCIYMKLLPNVGLGPAKLISFLR